MATKTTMANGNDNDGSDDNDGNAFLNAALAKAHKLRQLRELGGGLGGGHCCRIENGGGKRWSVSFGCPFACKVFGRLVDLWFFITVDT